ncbi:MAG TPA: hypothetical protein DCS67_00410 [Clostridiales bacterium UBA8960]|nr:hypothetical protein [Clostridiales bacterium UBA8960]
MNDIIESLKKMIILSFQDLTRIRSSISRTYAHLSSSDRAEILSLAVHNLLNKHLDGIDHEHRESLKINILETTLSRHVYSITKNDVFESIVTMNLPEDVRMHIAESWLIESAKIDVPKGVLIDYLVTQHQFTKKTVPVRKNRVSIAFMLLFTCLAIGLFLFHEKPQTPSVEPNLRSASIVKGYEGLSQLDRVYLISDVIDGIIVKKTVPFGIGQKEQPFRYDYFHYFNIKHYIATTRKGLIAHPEYFNRVIHLAYLNDIDPLLLFAIIGQEQAFVNEDSSHSLLVVNNPFNVFHSWIDYNTTLRDSTKIAINTIKRRMANIPPGISPFLWLNGVYAEDPNWHYGVSWIYAHLKNIGRF